MKIGVIATSVGEPVDEPWIAVIGITGFSFVNRESKSLSARPWGVLFSAARSYRPPPLCAAGAEAQVRPLSVC
jgi:hypothetical protein